MVVARNRYTESQSGGSGAPQGVTAVAGSREGTPDAEKRGMARITAQQYALAEAVAIAPGTLADWYARQCQAQRKYLEKLEGAMKAAMADPRLNDRDDALWKTYWMLDARYRYAFETLGLLARREHVIVCPIDGIPGVLSEEELPLDQCAGLSLRGLLTGEDRFTWERYCESHSPEIETLARKLYQEWKG